MLASTRLATVSDRLPSSTLAFSRKELEVLAVASPAKLCDVGS